MAHREKFDHHVISGWGVLSRVPLAVRNSSNVMPAANFEEMRAIGETGGFGGKGRRP